MKHTDALIALITRIDADLKNNEEQLLAAREKVAKLQQRGLDLKQQLGRARYAGHLKGDSCPDCYVTHGKDQPLSTNIGAQGKGLVCPACNWSHAEAAPPPAADNDKWLLKLETGMGFQTLEL